MYFAAQCEIALSIMDEVLAGDGKVWVRTWIAAPDLHLQHSFQLLVVPFVIIAILGPAILAESGLVSIVAVLLAPAAVRLGQVFEDLFKGSVDERNADADREPDPHYLPRAPTFMVLVFLFGALGLTTLHLLDLFGFSRTESEVAVLVVWATVSVLMALFWRRRMTVAGRRIDGFLGVDEQILRQRLRVAVDTGRNSEELFALQAMETGALWPPRWVDQSQGDGGDAKGRGGA